MKGFRMALQRQPVDGGVLWTAALNGERCQFVTTDASLVLSERGIANGEMVGVELVDQSGERRAWSVRMV